MTIDNLGLQVRQAREAKRMSRLDLAELLDVSVKTIGNWENGHHIPRSSIGALERVLGISLYGLDVVEPKPPTEIDLGALSPEAREHILHQYELLLKLPHDSS